MPAVMTRSITIFVLVALFAWPSATLAQKKALDHDTYEIWNRIGSRSLSNDGAWALYTFSPEKGDGTLHVKSLTGNTLHEVPRGSSPGFTEDSRFVIFQIEPAEDSVRAAKKAKVKDDEMPKDTLGILDLTAGSTHYVPRVSSYRLPSEAGGVLAYMLEKSEADSIGEGSRMVLHSLVSGEDSTFTNAKAYEFSSTGAYLAYTYEGEDSLDTGLVLVTTETMSSDTLMSGGGEYRRMEFDESGTQLAFLANREWMDMKPEANGIYFWRVGMEGIDTLATMDSDGLPEGWWVSPDGSLSFSENGERLFFGSSPQPPQEDDEEEEEDDEDKVVLDVWNWKDPLLQPMQLQQLQQERTRSYRAAIHLESGRIIQLASKDLPQINVAQDGDADLALGFSDLPYRQNISWDFPRYTDVYAIDVNDGSRTLLMEGTRDRPSLSADTRYLAWWDREALGWMAMPSSGGEAVNLTSSIEHPLYNELHDWPYLPSSYGYAGWTETGEFLVYDKHDIWALDPSGTMAPRNVTNGQGRHLNLRFRYQTLDFEQDAIPDDLLLTALDYTTKAGGFYTDQVTGDAEPRELVMMDRSFFGVRKADDADRLMFTRQSFVEFGDLWTSALDFEHMTRISNVNPQQSEYRWGTAELVEWVSLDGIPLQGMLFKPEGFDPNQKYPMMVYFYEKMSNGLHSHRPPATSGSSISFAFYVSRGYVVFVPDIPYKVGYPGESALNAVVPGVTKLINQGFVHPDKVGVQGHSWGGYQIAYMITETDLFAAAEAGAPVSNMTSAYGGIRWGSGMSRMFQYEKTQSRIGGSLWETPLRYIDNSPLFQADKVKTPLLMMHNDDDGAVPWYQGIELFVALRRLGKPVWMLNYNGAGHGLSKYANRRDWAIRMQQFFDHYLMDAPAPVWLAKGIPAIEKGETLGLEDAESN